MSQFSLVADIGGTNIRLGLVQPDDKAVSHIRTYQCVDFASLELAIRRYCLDEAVSIKAACLAIACPVENDQVDMTNHHWSFSQKALKQALELEELSVINDYTAIALSIPDLDESQAVQIGRGQKQSNKPIAVYGPGTGLGVAHLVNVDNQWHHIAGEGGHVDFAPIDEDDQYLLRYLSARYPEHVSVEQVLSGLGLVQIYQAICQKQQIDAKDHQPKHITELALNGECPLCEQALAQFCRVLGSFGGNLAMNVGAFGGVYIAGGIVPRFIDYLATSEFRQRFEAKGRFNQYLSAIPTYVINESQPGLIGARAYLYSKLGR